MAIVLDGNLGITTPAETVQGALTTTGNTILGDATTDTLNVGNGGLVKDASGNVGIGTASPATKLEVNGPIRVGSTDPIYFGGTTNYITGSNGSNYLQFVTNATERMRIDSSGNLCLNTTSAVASQAYLNIKANPATNWCIATQPLVSNIYNAAVFFNLASSSVGTIVPGASSTAYNTTSDYRLKENIASMTGALTTVSQLKPVTYSWKADGSDGQGFIAHELQAVVPDCVTGEKDAVDAEGNPVHQGVDTSFLVATLTAAIQEQQALIIQLQADVAALKALSA